MGHISRLSYPQLALQYKDYDYAYDFSVFQSIMPAQFKPCFSMPNRAWLLIGRPHSGRRVLPERRAIPYWLLWQLNGNKNRRAKFYALPADYIVKRLHRVVQNKPDYSTFQQSLRKFA